MVLFPLSFGNWVMRMRAKANTSNRLDAEPSKAWCANTPVLTGGYKMTEGHRILEVEGELEVVWEAATRESQRLREVVLGSSSLSPATVAPALRSTSGQTPARIPCVEDHLSCSLPPPFTSRQNRLPHPLQRSPMFDSDSDQHQNPSSDESEKSRRD
ncbi:centrosomal of 89 kDa-like protein [Labeo rohita]|uniref:Centrosomal of 89 kDa-like protein n=1 Tax=Labeo rohita TaxID=84645 RepID=A0A498MIZ2_LABRO|nr:centrosomal of 89 kDa-like protein [Labeo rohita]